MADIKSEILLVSKETDIPVVWVQIFAECVQNVANRLGVLTPAPAVKVISFS